MRVRSPCAALQGPEQLRDGWSGTSLGSSLPEKIVLRERPREVGDAKGPSSARPSTRCSSRPSRGTHTLISLPEKNWLDEPRSLSPESRSGFRTGEPESPRATRGGQAWRQVPRRRGPVSTAGAPPTAPASQALWGPRAPLATSWRRRALLVRPSHRGTLLSWTRTWPCMTWRLQAAHWASLPEISISLPWASAPKPCVRFLLPCSPSPSRKKPELSGGTWDSSCPTGTVPCRAGNSLPPPVSRSRRRGGAGSLRPHWSETCCPHSPSPRGPGSSQHGPCLPRSPGPSRHWSRCPWASGAVSPPPWDTGCLREAPGPPHTPAPNPAAVGPCWELLLQRNVEMTSAPMVGDSE
ncbi:uncharacterized protein LOC123381542 isoform X2 [Felis catus]|uniref:uncharacterized protein LOC123381542 isoform X2 n=1 Tax=Felis catus TaxID=9685 RepID=UPI001D1A0A51|nr:uncharacterized protein LOC123381542 isoform X2 [Felis catus]